MLINLEGSGPVMWQGNYSDAESRAIEFNSTYAEMFLESAIEYLDACDLMQPSITAPDAILFNKTILTLQSALCELLEDRAEPKTN